MNMPTNNPPSPEEITSEQITAALAQSHSADEGVALASLAETLGDLDLMRRCLGQAIALDRNCRAALVMLAAQSMDDGDADGTFALLEEAHRAGVLPEEAAPLHRALHEQVAGSMQLENYFRAIGRIAADKPAQKLAIVLVTNLFPPQELGGYGRMMWEFAHGLIARGHTVRVLTSDTTDFSKTPTPDEVAMEQHVFRTLRMAGTWVAGKGVALTDRAEIVRRLRDNASRVRTAINKLDADLVLAGNLDFLGTAVLQPALQGRVPVLHALANATPGYGVAEQPKESHYWVAPCSDWNGEVFREAGYAPTRIETLYPGARVDRFFRLFLPDTRRLRICYASLMLPYKGANTLVHALGRLHAAGVDFTAEIAGDAPNADFLKEMQDYVTAHGMEAKVKFTGFLDRRSLSDLFARSNVLVFPSQFNEPFGISQVEALAAGLVVVSSGTGGAKEVIRDGVDGLLFTAGNDTELANRLTTLAQQPDLFTQLQRNAQARAITFSVEKSVQKIEALAAEMQAAASIDPLAALIQS
ncbi:MAG TPA: glycosyltransferase [Candidatus Didemnitutus sp.]|nr:glycosyltransferase [Candidatus Didemnitutus sp.]